MTRQCIHRICAVAWCALALGPFGAAHGQALYKCVGPGGKTSYQEDPCPVPAGKGEAEKPAAPVAARGGGAPTRAGWDAREVDAASDACAKPILADARRFFDAESKFFPEAQIVPPVDRFCTCATRRIASTWTHAEYEKNPEGVHGRIAREAMKGGPCKPDGLYAEMLRKTGKMR